MPLDQPFFSSRPPHLSQNWDKFHIGKVLTDEKIEEYQRNGHYGSDFMDVRREEDRKRLQSEMAKLSAKGKREKTKQVKKKQEKRLKHLLDGLL